MDYYDANKFYGEKLIPVRVSIFREANGNKYKFIVDAFRGEKTDEIFYKASEIKRIEAEIEELKLAGGE